MRTAVVDGAQTAAAQIVGVLVGIDHVALVARLLLAAPVADQHAVYAGREQVVERVPSSNVTCTAPRIASKNSRSAPSSVGTTLRAMMRPLSSRTEATVVA